MFKKLSSIVATAALLIAGASVTPAQAAVSAADITSLAGLNTNIMMPLTDPTSIPVEAGQTTVSVYAGFGITKELAATWAGKTLGYTISVKDPSGKSIPDSSTFMSPPTVANYYAHPSLSLSGKCMASYFNAPAVSVVLPVDTSDCAGSLTTNVNIAAGTGTLATGNYSVVFNLTINGTVVSSGTSGFSVLPAQFYYNYSSLSYTAPSAAANAYFTATVCADKSKLVVGDTLAGVVLYDGVELSNGQFNMSNRAGSNTDVGRRLGNATNVVTTYDTTAGIYARLSNSVYTGASGAHTVAFKFYDTTTSTDVTGPCKPGKPGTPTLTFDGTQLSTVVLFPSDTPSAGQAMGTCDFYDTAAPTVSLGNVLPMMMGPNSPATCTFSSGLIVGHSYFVKTTVKFIDVASDQSDPSSNISITAPGYNISTAFAGTMAAGKLVKVNSNSIPVDSAATQVTTLGDGANGVYQISLNQTGGMNAPPAVVGLNLTHITSSGIDSAFGNNTGKVSITPTGFDLYSYLSGVGLYGANRDKFAAYVGGASGNYMAMTNKGTLYLGSASSSTVTAVDVSNAAFTTACASVATGYTSGGNAVSITPVSSNGANLVAVVNCFKTTTFSDNTIGAVRCRY